MTLTTEQGVLDALPGRILSFMKTGPSTTFATSGYSSLWLNATVPAAGAIPPTGAGAVPTRSTTGALDMGADPGSGNTFYLGRLRAYNASPSSHCLLFLYDRLVHTSGLDSTVLTAQTVNSVAVNRPDSTGTGVQAYLEVYSGTGGSVQSVTVSYTNQAGTAGRTGTVTFIANGRPGDLYPIALQSGDSGVRSVQTVTMAGSTGTAGNFGITLLRSVAHANLFNNSTPVPTPDKDWLDVALATIDTNACLALAAGPTAISGSLIGSVYVIEG